ncbi:MAG TPA: helix-turn-helix transcriptional regulator [Candidatus Brocadiia bacterium]|nr:helix-turn-helix domain-containing protein [Planctomycetota bacterium]MDO8093682.1 helix-turn-helix domain-containing protein [Candidatus Brocadiales bacterium]
MGTNIKEKLMHLRAEKGWCRSETARRAKIPVTTYQSYEQFNRKPSGEHALAVARAFGVTVEYLIDDAKGYPPTRTDRLAEETRPYPAKIDTSILPNSFQDYLNTHPEKLALLSQLDIEELASIRGYGGEPLDPEYWVNKHIKENEILDKCKMILSSPQRDLLIGLINTLYNHVKKEKH